LPAEAEFIRGFPQRYLRAYTTAEIEAHAQLYKSSRSEGVAVRLERFGGAYKLTVIAWDRPALFATLSGAISSFGLDIVKAEAFCNSRGIILDNFVVTDPRRTLELNPPEADRLQDLIRRAASGKTEVKRLLRGRPRRNGKAPAIEPQVRVDSEACETATLFEIVAEDRPGLLYSLAAVFSSNSCDIDLVLVDTRGARAMDVFYVARGGGRLSSEVQSLLQEQLLAACRGD
jgi:[protein-PII] uridylyltransferase